VRYAFDEKEKKESTPREHARKKSTQNKSRVLSSRERRKEEGAEREIERSL
jgi:hypothetical protein